ncbi:translation initiation factor IF-2 [Niabella drilacis]|uniref:Translation initiation factor IF-2 n=1 Tax=Niabella drilacis (strain DSM 25811 / CCM 8410 / CCUG 62505 / LMG 26954 / E90) TaxID=1285928 RepID=A0A1G6N2W0_NIADE|nr:translation initiation factor IF-2 [Niabella drilacis]SDC62031.1 translation initiation factor IF-2 [Niabella drilacis]
MVEKKLPRLLQAAKEFNIGQDTLVEFLVGKGFERDDLKPSTKLTDAMYTALQQGFHGDKAAKIISDQVDLPKGLGGEGKKRREEEEVPKPASRPVSKDEPVVETPPVAEPVTVVAEPEAPVKEAEVPAAEPEPVPQPEVTENTAAVQEEEAPVAKTPVTGIGGPKIIDKIDLSAIDFSTRPKKVAKKETPVAETPKPRAEEPVAASQEPVMPEPPVEEKPEVKEKPAPVEEEKPAEVQITNIQAEKIEGPKILGKIELPVDSDTRPKRDEKRKRKRIPIEKKEVKADPDQRRPHGGQQNQAGRSGGHQHGGGGHHGKGNFRDRHRPHREEKQIDEKEIQEKIRETQAKLSGGSGNKQKSMRAKARRDKRNEAAEAMEDEGVDKTLRVTEFISVSELASLMDVSFADVISKCMSLGIMVSINQRLDAEVIELVASEFGYDVSFIDMEQQMEMEEEAEEEDDDAELVPRSPIVTIMGHVDHGKTSLLDYIRNANVVAGEAGGITQHIGAYRVKVADGKEITFLDTPGHEAFTAMRARGAKVTDIAVIVVAADDAVMPQTREAISHAQAAGVPMIFAVNKIDKDGANPQKIYEQLSQMNILVEEWGGKFQSQELSAKQGLNVDKLLEKILLEAELLDLKANPGREATGTIIEATLDKGRGYVATLLVENGTLKPGDVIVSGQYFGRVKAMFNERNKREEAAGPSAPAVVLGLNGAPQAGEKFKVYEEEAEAKSIANRRSQILREQGMRTKKHITLDEIGRRLALGNFKELNVIIKGDVDGSVEALSDSLQKLSTEEILVSVIHKGVGQINESDIVLAEASDAIVIAFNVRPSQQASQLANNAGIEIKMYSIIYTAIDEVKSAMEGMLEPTMKEKIVGNVEIREVFKFDKAVVAGCLVLDGRIKRDNKVRLIRDGIVIYPTGENAVAELGSLKRFKDDAKEVLTGMECGLTIKNYNDIRIGDVVEAYELEEVKRTL